MTTVSFLAIRLFRQCGQLPVPAQDAHEFQVEGTGCAHPPPDSRCQISPGLDRGRPKGFEVGELTFDGHAPSLLSNLNSLRIASAAPPARSRQMDATCSGADSGRTQAISLHSQLQEPVPRDSTPPGFVHHPAVGGSRRQRRVIRKVTESTTTSTPLRWSDLEAFGFPGSAAQQSASVRIWVIGKV